MIHGLQTSSLALGRAISSSSRMRRSTMADLGWRSLNAERRLAMIEEKLGRIGISDGYPLAL